MKTTASFGILIFALALSARVQAQFAYSNDGNGTCTITGYTGPGGAVAIPAIINGLPVTAIGADTFAGLGLTSVTIPDTVTSIGAGAFEECVKLTSVTIPGSVRTIGEDAFDLCGLTSVSIGGGVISIGEYAFSECQSLTSVTIPASVTSIGDYAFFYCGSNLRRVFFGGNAPYADDTVFIDAQDATAYYLAGTVGWSSTFAGRPAELWNPAPQIGSLQVTILPAQAIAFGAKWQVAGGSLQKSGATVTNLSVGVHEINFDTVRDWIAPTNQTASITVGTLEKITQIFRPSTPVALLVNGYGTVQHADWPANLVIGKKYVVKAVPLTKNIFSNWVGGTSQPYSLLSISSSYTFVMQSNLVLEANFVPNPFLPVAGVYNGLFSDTNGIEVQSSGFFTATATANGNYSGKIQLAGNSYPITGKFSIAGFASNLIARSEPHPLSVHLELDLSGGDILTGQVSNGAWTAELSAERANYSAMNADNYTLVIPGGTNAAVTLGGDGYGVVAVNRSGTITVSGVVSDGTTFSQSATLSEQGHWPFYASLYSGGGEIIGWLTFSNAPMACVGARAVTCEPWASSLTSLSANSFAFE
jgi:hypothetical protein